MTKNDATKNDATKNDATKNDATKNDATKNDATKNEWMEARGVGVCTICGRALGRGGRYWLTAYPDGVHHGCREWQLEPFPFHRDLTALRRIARVVREAWRLTLAQGRWLAIARQRWPAGARAVADDWLERKAKLEQRLNELRDRMRF